jgi:hypothetical protein
MQQCGRFRIYPEGAARFGPTHGAAIRGSMRGRSSATACAVTRPKLSSVRAARGIDAYHAKRKRQTDWLAQQLGP